MARKVVSLNKRDAVELITALEVYLSAMQFVTKADMERKAYLEGLVKKMEGILNEND